MTVVESSNGCYAAENKGLSEYDYRAKLTPNQAWISSAYGRQKPGFVSRFLTSIHYTPTCWLWTGAYDAYGYGQLFDTTTRRPIKVHRIAWMLTHADHLTPSVHVLHRCDVRHCVNQAHLFLGDQAANMKDAAAKGRLHGARPSRRRLSNEAMAAILAAPEARGVGVQLAAAFGVSKTYVSLLRRGLREWRA